MNVKIGDNILKSMMHGSAMFDEESEDLLSKFGYELVAKAAGNQLQEVVGRDVEICKLIQILHKRVKNNPILIGSSGVGKTAIVEGLAQWCAKGQVPKGMKFTKIYVLDYGALISKSIYKGQFEGVVKQIVSLLQRDGNYILFIDEIHSILSPQKLDNSIDLANLLKPILARGLLPVIGATTIEEYRRYIATDPAFSRRFTNIIVPEMSRLETVELLKLIKPKLESFHKITISDKAIETAVRLSEEYMPNQYLPDKAIDIVDQACATFSIEVDNLNFYLLRYKTYIKQLESLNDIKYGTDCDLTREIQAAKDNLIEQTEMCARATEVLERINKLNDKLELSRLELLESERNFDYNAAARIKHEEIPELEAQLLDLNQELEQVFPLKHKHINSSYVVSIVAEMLGIFRKDIFVDSFDVQRTFEGVRNQINTLEVSSWERASMHSVLESIFLVKTKTVVKSAMSLILLLGDRNDAYRIVSRTFGLFSKVTPIAIDCNGQFLHRLSFTYSEGGLLAYLCEQALNYEFETGLNPLLVLYAEDLSLVEKQFSVICESVRENLSRTTIFIISSSTNLCGENLLERAEIDSVVSLSEPTNADRFVQVGIEVNKRLYSDFQARCTNLNELVKFVLKKYDSIQSIQGLVNVTIRLFGQMLVPVLERNSQNRSLVLKFNSILQTLELERLLES